MSEHAPESWRRIIRRRLAIVLTLFAAWGITIEARLLYLQVYQHDAYVARAERQHKRTLDVAAKRGDILDRNDRVLAFSVDAESIYAVPSEIGDAGKTIAALCTVLDGCNAEFRATVRERLSRRRAFAWVKAAGVSRRGPQSRRARSRGYRIHDGAPPVLPEHLARSARDRIRGSRQPGTRRHRSGLQPAHQGAVRHRPDPDRRAPPRIQPDRASPDDGCDRAASRSTRCCSGSRNAS